MAKTFGLRLNLISEVPDKVRAKLQALNIHTAEELVAMAAVKGANELLAKHIGIPVQDLSDFMGKVKNSLPSRVVSAMEAPYIQRFPLGALEPPSKMLAAAISPYKRLVAEAALPSNVNYISRLRPIRNQGERGTCVAFSCTALNEDYHRPACPDLSEQNLYQRCKDIDGMPNDNGTYVKVAMDCLRQSGQCTRTCQPYNPNLPTNQPGPYPPCAAVECPQYQLPSSIQLDPKSVIDIKGALADGKTVAFCIPVYHSWYDSAAVAQTGNITMPLPDEQSDGGHSMLFVGYQDAPDTPGGGYFILRNSWGTNWGYNDTTYPAGYGTLPYNYMTNYAWEAYTT